MGELRILLLLLLSLVFSTLVVAQESDFNLDEFEKDLSGGIEKEKQKEKAAIKKASAEAEDEDVERVTVTGSHIKRIDIEGPSPIQVIDRKAMELSGYNSVSDVLRDTTGNSFGSRRETSGSTAAGASGVSLRGLGSNKTLVLLNGKRLPNDAVTGSVDLNLIPMAAVKKIEILKDGASATYGSDALGGVVNIITYKDYNGLEITGRKSYTKLEGGEMQEASIISGSSTSNSSTITVISYRQNNKIMDADREWSDYGESTIGSPGSFRDNSGVWKADPNHCPAANVWDFDGSNEYCRFDFTKYSSAMPKLNQLSGMSLFEYETDKDVTIFGRVNVVRKKVEWNYAPAPGVFSVPAAVAATLGLGGAYAGGDIAVRYRTLELGNRVSEIETTAIGYQGGLKGNIGSSTWEWEFTVDQNRVRRVDIGVEGYALASTLQDLMASGDFNPFAADGSRDPNNKLDTARYEPWQKSVSLNTMYELKTSGEFFDTKNGAVAGAVGVSYIGEEFTDVVDKLSENGDVFGGAGSSGGGSRNSKAIYTEIGAPLAKGFELQLAGRHDKFSDFGSTTNPKVGMRWQVSKALMVRGSWGTGFKAPSMNDLYAATSSGYPTFIDKVACDANPGTAYCNPAQWLVTSSGNSGLKEEESESMNIGVVFQPNKKSSISIDVWETRLDNVVGIDYEALTQAELNGVNLSQYGVTVNRTGGIIDEIVAPLQNLSKQEVAGIDIAASTQTGIVSLKWELGYVFHFKQEGFPGTGLEDLIGSNGFPQWKNNVTVGFGNDNNQFNFLFRTIDSHKKSDDVGELRRYTEIDFSYVRQLWQNASATLGVNNLLGSTPPLDDTNTNNQLLDTLYNPRGPLAYISFKQNF